MDAERLKHALAAVKRTRRKFNRLSERSGVLDERLSELPEPPPLDRPLKLMLLVAVAAFAALIGLLAVLA